MLPVVVVAVALEVVEKMRHKADQAAEVELD
jgi:hypothetical protein